MREITGIIVHCSATPPEWMAGETLWQQRMEIRRWHVVDRGWAGVGYNWLVGRDGMEVKGRDLDGDGDPWEHIGAHVRGHNANSIGICLVGGLGSHPDDEFLDNFTRAQEAALIARIEDLRRIFPTIKYVEGHNEFDAGKACPGFRVAKWYPAARAKYYAGSALGPGPAAPPLPLETPEPPKQEAASSPPPFDPRDVLVRLRQAQNLIEQSRKLLNQGELM